MQWVSIVLSSVLSGLLGVLVSNWYHYKAEKRRWKLRILEQLLGNRHDISGEQFTKALNAVFIVFHDSKEVVLALKAFHEIIMSTRTSDLANQKLLDLFKAMCKELKISTEPLTDNFFLKPFSTKKA